MARSKLDADALDHVNDPVAVVRDGHVRYANDQFGAFTGIDDPAGGRVGAFAPRDAELDLERFCDAVQSGDPSEATTRLVLDGADGDRVTALVDATRTDYGGDPAAVLVVDEAASHPVGSTSPERYERLVEALPLGVCQATAGRDGEFELVNDAMVSLFDAASKDALVGREVGELFADAADYEQFGDRLDADGEVRGAEVELETLDGEPFWAAVTAVADESGEDTVYDGAVQDITRRKEMEREYRQRARQFRRMFQRHSAPMLLVDPDTGGIQNANDAAAEFYGYTKRKLTGMTVDDLNRLSADAIARKRERAREEDRNRFEFPHELADGTVRTVAVHSSPIELDDQDLLFSVVHDITERVDYEDRLESQRDNLDVLNRVLRHDIRNDLQLVLAYAEMLADEVDDAHAEHVEHVRESADHAVELTETARDIADVMLADAEPVESVPLRPAVENEVDDVRSAYPGAALMVDENIPDVTVEANGMVDSVFRNLLKNAVQHNDKPVPEVTVSVTADDDTATVRIADNGPGVPDGQKDDVFGKGEKGLESSGTGMGLYLVQTLVDGAGGEVWVEDNDPEGAVFVVELPVA